MSSVMSGEFEVLKSEQRNKPPSAEPMADRRNLNHTKEIRPGPPQAKILQENIRFIAEPLFSECFPLHFPAQVFVQICKKI